MKRSAIASMVLSAACGFAVTGLVALSPSLQADDAPVRKLAEPTISTASYSIALQQNLETGNPQLIVTNLTDKSLRVDWTQRLQSTGKVSAMSRMIPPMKDVSSESRSVELEPKGTSTVSLLPTPLEPAEPRKALAEFESRRVVLESGGKSFMVPLIAPQAPAK